MKLRNFSIYDPFSARNDARLPLIAISIILVLTAMKFVVAALSPLAFDEALYWRYSKHLAAGFIDHPYLNPLMIRVGTTLFGDRPLGVRFMAILLSLPATWAVWRASASLFADAKIAVASALIFSLTIVMTIGSMVATSDEIVVVTTTFLLLFWAKLNETGRGQWWLALGAAFGFGLCAKYTTIFFAVSLFAWIVLAPGQRKWLISPWSWAGGLLASLIFSPVLLWNAQHGWESFVYQSGRLTNYSWTFKYVLELLGALALLSTPPIFVLGVIGSARLFKDKDRYSASIILLSMLVPMGLYFLWLSTHERVQGNWTEPMFPAFSIAAAVAACGAGSGREWVSQCVLWARRFVTPIGLLLALVAFVEAPTGFIPLGRHDVRARVLGVGWPELAKQIDAIRAQTHADIILTSDYTLNSWAKFYLPPQMPIEQFDERVRWTNEPPPTSALPHGTALYICGHTCWKLPKLQKKFASTSLVATLSRYKTEDPKNHYKVFELKNPVAPIFDPPNFIPRADHDD